jgi:hypothetical protein
MFTPSQEKAGRPGDNLVALEHDDFDETQPPAVAKNTSLYVDGLKSGWPG